MTGIRRPTNAQAHSSRLCLLYHYFLICSTGWRQSESTVSSAFLLFFQSYSLYNISFFRAKKGNKTAFRAIFIFEILHFRTAHAIMPSGNKKKIEFPYGTPPSCYQYRGGNRMILPYFSHFSTNFTSPVSASVNQSYSFALCKLFFVVPYVPAYPLDNGKDSGFNLCHGNMVHGAVMD